MVEVSTVLKALANSDGGQLIKNKKSFRELFWIDRAKILSPSVFRRLAICLLRTCSYVYGSQAEIFINSC